ncbi:ABC transporter permease [Paenibacillus sp. S150]|uniref:ABC transporter permease n=1 Tax=Paenibacillus sp. S150 TaxID=2749826 RepID=UPI001C5917B6|nr:ABC transporter permease [Paenibacillus sp. S150]MBW4079803.1 ABC transporter permease [Paenibacillus sp. S150]
MSNFISDTGSRPVLEKGKKGSVTMDPQQYALASRNSRLKEMAGNVITPLLTFIILFSLWELVIRAFDVKMIILPAPSGIFAELFGSFSFYLPHLWLTFCESVLGFTIGVGVALIGGILMSQSRFLEKSLLPVAVLANVTPVVAIAPLFIIWFGFGALPKVLISAICSFFPMLINSIAGFRSIDDNNYEYLQSLHASKFEIFLKLRLPNSLPYIFTAARTCMSMSVIGAVVGEMSGASEGIGNVITVSGNYMQMERMFAAIMLLALMGILLTSLVKVVERRFLHWHSMDK